MIFILFFIYIHLWFMLKIRGLIEPTSDPLDGDKYGTLPSHDN